MTVSASLQRRILLTCASYRPAAAPIPRSRSANSTYGGALRRVLYEPAAVARMVLYEPAAVARMVLHEPAAVARIILYEPAAVARMVLHEPAAAARQRATLS